MYGLIGRVRCVQGKPLIAGFGERFETPPIGGVGMDDAEPWMTLGSP